MLNIKTSWSEPVIMEVNWFRLVLGCFSRLGSVHLSPCFCPRRTSPDCAIYFLSWFRTVKRLFQVSCDEKGTCIQLQWRLFFSPLWKGCTMHRKSASPIACTAPFPGKSGLQSYNSGNCSKDQLCLIDTRKNIYIYMLRINQRVCGLMANSAVKPAWGLFTALCFLCRSRTGGAGC